MIAICKNCGNYDWDKEVKGNRMRCPKCGEEWEFRSLPLFVLSGCSGVGKTTTAIEIMHRKVDFVVMDGDIFRSVMDLNSDEDYIDMVEGMTNFSTDIMQSGRPVLWAMAGCLDKFSNTYHSRFFSKIKCMALVCEESALRERMQKGRGITDENWINGSCDYNRYFMEHDSLGDMKFETLDITEKSPEEVADCVIEWVKKEWQGE